MQLATFLGESSLDLSLVFSCSLSPEMICHLVFGCLAKVSDTVRFIFMEQPGQHTSLHLVLGFCLFYNTPSYKIWSLTLFYSFLSTNLIWLDMVQIAEVTRWCGPLLHPSTLNREWETDFLSSTLCGVCLLDSA